MAKFKVSDRVIVFSGGSPLNGKKGTVLAVKDPPSPAPYLIRMDDDPVRHMIAEDRLVSEALLNRMAPDMARWLRENGHYIRTWQHIDKGRIASLDRILAAIGPGPEKGE